MLYRFDIYLCKINMELQAYLIMGIFNACWQRKESLHFTKLMWIFQKLGLLYTSNSHQIFENNVCLTLFYANLLQYKLLNIKVTMQWQDEQVMEILRRKTEEVSYPLREMDQYEDQSKDILNSILQEVLSDGDSEALIEELWADEVS